MKPNGEFGGVVVRSLRTAGGVLPPGTEINAEDACSWPVMNRRALSEGGIVRWHTQRGGDDAEVVSIEPEAVVEDAEPEAVSEEAYPAPEPNAEDEASVEPEKRRGRPAKAKETE